MWFVCEKEARRSCRRKSATQTGPTDGLDSHFRGRCGQVLSLCRHQRRNHFCHSHGLDIDGRLHEMATQRNIGKNCRRSDYCQRLELWAGTRHLIVPDIATERFVAGHHPR
jgi:hypothetical protein